MSPGRHRLYWACAGEVLTIGGPFRLAGEDGGPTLGGRPLTLQRATELAEFYEIMAGEARDPSALRHCRDCAGMLRDAMLQVSRWRRAA